MKKHIFVLIVFFLCLTTFLSAQSYKVIVAQLPPSTEQLVKLMNAIAEHMKVEIKIEQYSMSRMVKMLIKNEADIGLPMLYLKDPNQIKNIPYDYSSASILNMVFILYTNKNKPIDLDALKKGNSSGYKIESNATNADLFPFKTAPCTDYSASFKRLDQGVIDGFIIAQISGDAVLRQSKLTSIRRQLYENFDTGWILPKGMRGSEVDTFLVEGLKKIKESGDYMQILGESLKTNNYNPWQP